MSDDETLVRAMPRRLLYDVSGFCTRIDMAVLAAVDEDGWCATRSAIAADIDCKEARLAVAVVRRPPGGAEGLVAEGRLLRFAAIPPEAIGLAGFKNLAIATAQALCPEVRSVELLGYLNEEADRELRQAFFLVYRAIVPPGTAATEGAAWMPASSAWHDRASRLCAGIVC